MDLNRTFTSSHTPLQAMCPLVGVHCATLISLKTSKLEVEAKSNFLEPLLGIIGKEVLKL